MEINEPKLKKTLRKTTFLKQIKSRFSTQKPPFNTRSIYENVLEYLSVILEDEKRFSTYFKKRFPTSFKYLPIVKFVIFLFILITLKMDYQTYSVLSSPILEEEFSIPAQTKFCSQYSFCLYFVVIIYEFVLSVYVTLKANSPVRNVFFQMGKHALRAAGASGAITLGYSYAPVEPNIVSNFIHTQTPLGRGYDYEVGSFGLKAKGDLISSALGNKDMMSAAQKYAPDSSIIDIAKLNDIIKDPEFKYKIRLHTTSLEKMFIGIPLVDTTSLAINPEGPDVLDLSSLKDTDNNNDTGESITITPVSKELPVRRHHSERLSQKSNRPVMPRRKTY